MTATLYALRIPNAPMFLTDDPVEAAGYIETGTAVAAYALDATAISLTPDVT